MTLRRGRDVSEADGSATAVRVAVVNETLVRRIFAGQDPLGRQLTIGRDKTSQNLQIVGVVSDAKYQRLQEEPRAVSRICRGASSAATTCSSSCAPRRRRRSAAPSVAKPLP